MWFKACISLAVPGRPIPGVALAAAVDREQDVVGEVVTITATVTSDGVLVTTRP